MRAKLEAVLRRVKRPTRRFFGVALLLLWAGGFAPLSPYGDEARITFLPTNFFGVRMTTHHLETLRGESPPHRGYGGYD